MSKKTKKTNDCNLTLQATLNKKEQPNSLYVHGSVMVYTDETEVTIAKAVPQGINPEILLLELTVIKKHGPMKGVPREFHYEESGDQVNTYSQVQVISNQDDNCTVDIKILG